MSFAEKYNDDDQLEPNDNDVTKQFQNVFDEADKDYFRQKIEQEFKQIHHLSSGEPAPQETSEENDICPFYGLKLSDMVREEQSDQPDSDDLNESKPSISKSEAEIA